MRLQHVETNEPERLPRGVYRERSSFLGYVGYKAITKTGIIAAHVVMMEALDVPELQEVRRRQLWEMIEYAEAQAEAIHTVSPLHIVHSHN